MKMRQEFFSFFVMVDLVYPENRETWVIQQPLLGSNRINEFLVFRANVRQVIKPSDIMEQNCIVQ